ncbi:MAG TPA: 4-(cytidine 5'-diphospho)-2-C-methyl-D-erythritol kinase [Mycobacteriales bacterium]|nr:4-(cytidine 5'-diphospho)-2-C-methyl-D-erythritol kinase [Mycobacteriales bacterium]
MPVVVRAPAKINLHLGVGPRRDDGYHELVTVFQAVDLLDEVVADHPAEPADATNVTATVTGEGADDVPAGEGNLAVRAARLLAERTGTTTGVHLSIRKAIPVAGGMAGGSADAAAALVACDALWGTALDRSDLEVLAAELGSDVPFSLVGGTALGTGRGVHLSPVLTRGSYAWVLALAHGGLSTPEVFTAYDAEERLTWSARADAVLAALRAGDPVALGAALTNDLQDAAARLRPDLRRTLEAAADLGALGAVVSGSGPTVALLAADADAATDLAAGLTGLGVCRTVRRADGPVPGARVVDR